MRSDRSPDVSVVVTFAEHEEVVGSAVRRLAQHLSALNLSFEIVAVDQGTMDNSRSVLALLRKDISQLHLASSETPDRAVYAGAVRALGRVLWVIDVDAALAPLAPFARAYRRIARGTLDIVAVQGRFTVCYRSRCLDAISLARGTGDRFQRSLFRRARPRQLATELLRGGSTSREYEAARPRRATLARLVDALTAARSAWTSPR